MLSNDYKTYLATPIRDDRKPLQDLLPLDRPLRLLIDPSDICNFRCKFCFQGKKNFHGQKMSMNTFNKIVEQLKDFDGPINVVHMYGLGEPMVNEFLPEFVRIIKDNNLAKEVAITSNGSLLTHKLSGELIDAGLDRLSISLNGVQDDDFKQIVGVKVSFEKMYREIQYFYHIRGKCHLHVKINGEDYSEEKKERFVELFKDCADSINIDHVVNVWPGLEVTKADGHRMYDYNLKGLSNEGEILPSVCPLMFYELLVHTDGSVSPCAVDYEYREENLGNIMQKSLKEIWDSEQLRKMRIESLKGENISYKVCTECSYTECAATVNITPFREELLKRYEV